MDVTSTNKTRNNVLGKTIDRATKFIELSFVEEFSLEKKKKEKEKKKKKKNRKRERREKFF